MKTSEEKLNEALRAALKRKFDDYEGVPFSSPFAKKPGRLERGRKWKYLFFTGLFLGISVGGIMLDQHYLRSRAVKIDYVVSGETKAKKGADNIHISKQNKAVSELAHLAHSVLIKKENKRDINNVIFSKSKLPNKIIKLKIKSSKLFSEEQNIKLSNAQIKDENWNKINAESVSQNIISSNPVENQFKNNAVQFNPELLYNKGMKFNDTNLTLPSITSVEKQDIKPTFNQKSEKINWLFNVSALRTYQLLTVPSTPGQNLQNFSFPSAFSLRSLGYKFSFGVEKKGVQLMLHYSGFRRSYSYEIVGNDYIVQPGSQGDYTIVRQAMQVSEDRKVSLLGLGINKRIQWGHSPLSRFYAVAGLEYSHSLNSHQSLGWLNVGVGKQFLVNKRIIFQAGPYAEFSPVKISGSEDPFFYQPYRVGISLGIKLANP